jgi:6-phosphogluconate dehydrogenase
MNLATALFELIADGSTQNCSGTWASHEARDLGLSIPTIDVAAALLLLSALEETPAALHRPLLRRPIQYAGRPDVVIEQMKRALYAAVISTFAQGIALLKVASAV